MEDKNTKKDPNTAHDSAVRAGKTLRGTVITASREHTAKVEVSRYVKHPKYKKFIKQVKKFLVHDVANTAAVGDKVVIRESRPISKRKNFIIESNETVVNATAK